MKVPNIDVQDARQESALDEAYQVGDWADATTPEWVRCVGALWEASRPFAEAASLERQYRGLLRDMLTQDARAPEWVRGDPKKMISRRLDDLEVVVRQLRERSYFVAAALAADVATEIFPDESWVFSVAANCARQVGEPRRALQHVRRCAELLEAAGAHDAPGAWVQYAATAFECEGLDTETLAFALGKYGADPASAEAILSPRADRPLPADTDLTLVLLWLERLMAIDPDAAIAKALARFDGLSPDDVAESDEGHALVELLLSALTERKDARAVPVAERILDAKLERWGECPATWLERQNLGGPGRARAARRGARARRRGARVARRRARGGSSARRDVRSKPRPHGEGLTPSRPAPAPRVGDAVFAMMTQR